MWVTSQRARLQMPGPLEVPNSFDISPDQPIRLAMAAKIAFPDGSMTASGLRRERDRGRLVVEKIAGKEYTSLAQIERMRELCRVEAKVQGSGYGQKSGTLPEALSGDPPGSSSMAKGISPQMPCARNCSS